jgi:hypothetical protein
MIRSAALVLPLALFTCILALRGFQATQVPAEAPVDDRCSFEGRVVDSVTGALVPEVALLFSAGDQWLGFLGP